MEKPPKGPEYYNGAYRASQEYQGSYKDSHFYVLWTQIVQIAKRFPSPRILEIGCGTGQLAHYLYDEGYRDYHGFDFSPVAVDLARKAVPMPFCVGDATAPDSYGFDYTLAIAVEVLEHVADDLAVLGRLKEQTPVIFSVPTRDDPAHVRVFQSVGDIVCRYYTHIAFRDIIPIGQWFVCHGVISRFAPGPWNRLFRTRRRVDWKYVLRRVRRMLRRPRLSATCTLSDSAAEDRGGGISHE
jgi:SAM-dependent methyltransferase